MKLHWHPHYISPDLSHAHHNGYSILRANNAQGLFMLGGAHYEVYPSPNGDEDIERFNYVQEVIEAISTP